MNYPSQKMFTKKFMTEVSFKYGLHVVEVYKPNTEGYDRKTDSLYLKGLLTEKMLVYDDQNLKIGCIRSVS